MSSEYPFWGAITLDDSSEVLLDLEEHGWAEKSRLARTVRFALIPKDDAPEHLRPVIVNLPRGSKPVFKSRVKVANPIGKAVDVDGVPIIRQSATLRIFGIGYKMGALEHLLWVLPNGVIEVGADSAMSDVLLRSMTFTTQLEGAIS